MPPREGDRPAVRLTLESARGDTDAAWVGLRRILKALLRRYGWVLTEFETRQPDGRYRLDREEK